MGKKGFRFNISQKQFDELDDFIHVNTFRKVMRGQGDKIPTDMGHKKVKEFKGENEKKIEVVQDFSRAFWIPGEVPSWKNSHMIRWKLRTDKQMVAKMIKLKKAGKSTRYIPKTIPYIGKSKIAKRYEEESMRYYNDLTESFRLLTKGQQPIWVEFFFVRANLRAKWDFMNMAQGVMDMMAKACWVEDDSIGHLNAIPPLSGPLWGHDRYSPGVRIRVLDMTVKIVE